MIKIGDTVRVKTFDRLPKHWVSEMDDYINRKVVITSIMLNYDYRINLDQGVWSWKEEDFEEIYVDLLTDKDVL